MEYGAGLLTLLSNVGIAFIFSPFHSMILLSYYLLQPQFHVADFAPRMRQMLLLLYIFVSFSQLTYGSKFILLAASIVPVRLFPIVLFEDGCIFKPL